MSVPPPGRKAILFAGKLDWLSIPPQPHRCGKKYRGERQPDPQPRTAQKSPRSNLRQRNKVRIDRCSTRRPKGKSVPRATRYEVDQQSGKMVGVECKLLN